MECLICPLKESMICSIFPCAISRLFTDEDKNQEGFMCQQHKFKAERGNQSPRPQPGATRSLIVVRNLHWRAASHHADALCAYRDHYPEQPGGKQVHITIKAWVWQDVATSRGFAEQTSKTKNEKTRSASLRWDTTLISEDLGWREPLLVKLTVTF